MKIKESPKLLKVLTLKFIRAKNTILISTILIIWSIILVAVGDFFGESKHALLCQDHFSLISYSFT